MAKKSKTQRAKASANRAAKKAAAEQAAEAALVEESTPQAPEKKKRFGKKVSSTSAQAQNTPAKASKPAKQQKSSGKSDKDKKKKKHNKVVQFFIDVRSEMRRVTWPTKQDVLQWTGVVIIALIFFALFCLILDNGVITPILVGLSNLGGLING